MPAKEAAVSLPPSRLGLAGPSPILGINVGSGPKFQGSDHQVYPALKGERLGKHQGKTSHIPTARISYPVRISRHRQRGHPQNNGPIASPISRLAVAPRNRPIPRGQFRNVPVISGFVTFHLGIAIVTKKSRPRRKKSHRHVPRPGNVVMGSRFGSPYRHR